MKTKTIKRYSFAMASVMFLTNAMPLLTFAVPTKDSLGSLDMNDNGDTVGVDFTQGQTTHYHEEITNEVTENTTVYVSQASSFGVIIPKTIILDGKTKNATYEVSVTGNIGGQESIEVVPEDSFLMKQQGKNDIDAIVTQDKTSWIYNEFETKGNGTIVAEDMTAGSWNGQFNFNIFLNENSNEEENETPLSLSLVTNELAIGTGEQAQVNAYYDGEDVTSIVNWESDNENIIVENGLIETKANAQVGDTATITVSVDENQLNETLVSSLIDTLTLTNVTYAENNDISIDFIVTIVDIEYTIESISLHPGESQDVTAKIIPETINGVVSWSSTAISGINLIRNGNTVTIKVADDMETGKTYYIIATYGNYSKTLPINIVSSHEHNYIANTQEATCTTNGKITYTCDCGSSYFETIDVLGHDFENEYTTDKEPTCTIEGSKSQHCSRCDATQNITSIDALGHSFNTKEISETYLAIASDCENAATYYFKCDRCDTKGSETYVNGSENGHQFSDWNTTTEPTCTTKGSEERSCSVCGKVETQDKDALGHDFASEYTTDKEPTCTTEGSKSQHCSRCEATQNVTTIDALGHIEVKGGTEQVHSSCSVCGTILSSTHTITSKVTIEPTCETMGTTQYTCDCGYSYATQNIDTIEHIYENEICKICGKEKVYAAGLYDENGIMTMSWDELISNKMITVTSDNALQNGSWERLNGHLVIDDSITKITYYAFQNCSKLTKITIPDSVTTIEKYAFAGSIGITELNIPNSVTIIGDYAFFENENLTDLTIPESVTTVSDSAFYNSNMTNISFESENVIFGTNVFYNCPNLKSVTLPSKLETIPQGTFCKCELLEIITIPNSVTTIDGYAFQYCKNLKTITIPNSVTSIGICAFNSCSSLEEIILSNNLTEIYFNVFDNCISLKNIVIPESVVTIRSNAFQNCKSLETINLPSNLTTIGEEAFYNCIKLDNIIIPNNITIINEGTFYSCTSLSNITIPNSVNTIGEFAFYNCTNLTNLIIPNSVTQIGNYAFKNVPQITYKGSATSTNRWGAKKWVKS